MHDPMTVAWEIRSPIPRREPGFGLDSKWRWVFPTIITIWHVDPERDGSDDSCDWSNRKVKPSEEVEKELRRMASWEERYPFYFDQLVKGPGDGAALLWSFWSTLVWRMNYNKPLWRRILFKADRRKLPREAYMKALQLCANECDNIMRAFKQDPRVFMPREYLPEEKWDTRHISRPGVDAETAYGHFRWFWRLLVQDHRPWWRHPRWHIHHWKIQVLPLQRFKRWAFSRCEICGKRFRYGEAPTSRMWDSSGPQWFKGEVGVRHSACDGMVAVTTTPEPPVQEPKP